MVNGPHFYRAFQHLHGAPTCFTMASHSPSRTPMGSCCRARRCQAHWDKLRVQCLARGHCDVDDWSQDLNLRPVISQPAPTNSATGDRLVI